ncbi:hypothetical protein KGQ72_01445 [Patescibacteria group bacterium]|nr:hypothetical protein [Patescibacteria group bacterium]
MTIAEVREKCKSLAARIPRDMLIIAVLVLACSASFGLGYAAGQEGSTRSPDSPPADMSDTGSTTGQIVASKNGTKYYLPGCAGANRISDANKIWFASVSAAQEAGYAPAANCAGR